jgi:hypothetical protein
MLLPSLACHVGFLAKEVLWRVSGIRFVPVNVGIIRCHELASEDVTNLFPSSSGMV